MRQEARFFKALADETRLQILWLLMGEEELRVCDISALWLSLNPRAPVISYQRRDRLEPWATLLPPDALDLLKKGGAPKDMSGLSRRIVSIGLGPDGPIPGLERMTLHVDAMENQFLTIPEMNFSPSSAPID